jgi:hypothetical protein
VGVSGLRHEALLSIGDWVDEHGTCQPRSGAHGTTVRMHVRVAAGTAG